MRAIRLPNGDLLCSAKSLAPDGLVEVSADRPE